MSRITWVAEVACEYGGPAIVADLSDYEKWMGATPYPIESRLVLHYWGQFTNELPAPYEQDGGHAYRKCDSFEELLSVRDALIVAIEKKFNSAKATVDDDAGEAHVLLPDSRQMWIELGPKSQYEEACEGDVVWSHEFHTPRGKRGHGVFWEKQGSGDFFVGVTVQRDELVLLRTWVDDEEFQDLAKSLVDDRHEAEEDDDDVHLELAEGKTIVAYSPHQWLETLGREKLESIMAEIKTDGLSGEEGMAKLLDEFRSLTARATGIHPVMLSADDDEDVAAVLSLMPGTYNVSVGCFDPDDDNSDDDDDDDDEGEREDSWSCIWCRFRRSSS